MGRPSNRKPGAVWALLEAWAESHPLRPNQRQIAGLIDASESLLTAWKYCQSTMQPDDITELAKRTEIPRAALAEAVAEDHPRVKAFQAEKAASQSDFAPAARNAGRKGRSGEARERQDEQTTRAPEDPTGMEPL